jgi:hypothetical protein
MGKPVVWFYGALLCAVIISFYPQARFGTRELCAFMLLAVAILIGGISRKESK